jgi:sugar phosphate isomerase/epimerase
MRIGAFTKSFQSWPIPVVCHRFKEIGLDGLDLTVRPGGHIEPENVAVELPLAAQAALEAGTNILLLTTGITDPTPEAETLLATAGKLGITHFKLGYYRYKPFGTLAAQIDETKGRIAAVAEQAKKYSMTPCVHVHSGMYIPSHGTLLYELLRDFPPDEVGAYADMLHMVLEGGDAGWLQGLDLLVPWLKLVAVKNFAWENRDRDKFGQQQWGHKVVPLADGVSPLPKYVGALKQAGFDGIFSLHSEYQGKGSFQDLDTEACLEQTAVDLRYFKSLLENVSN